MNTIESRNRLVAGLGAGVAFGALVVSGGPVNACDELIAVDADTAPAFIRLVSAQDQPQGLRVLSVVDDDGDDALPRMLGGQFEAHLSRVDDGRKIEVTIRDGDVTARLDGDEVPLDRIQQEGDRIIILDDAGNEIETIWLGQDRALRWNPRAAEPVEAPRVMLGIHLGAPGPALERHLRLEPGTTTMIEALYEGLPARNAGLDEFDIIVTIDGRSPAGPADLREALASKEVGDSLRLEVIHEGEPRTVTIRLDAFDREAMAAAKLIGGGNDPMMKTIEIFGGKPGMPGGPDFRVFGDMNTFDFDEQELDDLDNVFIDQHQRVFETLPDHVREMLQRRSPDRHPTERTTEQRDDSELREIEERLKALERMLEAVLEEHGQDR